MSEDYPVKIQQSLIPDAGLGLFAVRSIKKYEVICTYGGKLIDDADAKYMDPTYIVSWEMGKGFKLVGDDSDGDVGHIANSIHPNNQNITQNAQYVLHTTKKMLQKQYTSINRGRFYIIAMININAGDEIIVNYGPYYWNRVESYRSCGAMIKSQSIVDRDKRTEKRNLQRN